MEQLRRIIAGLSWRQRIIVTAGAILAVAAIYGVTRWNKERDFKPLYTGLSPEDAGAVVARLRESAIEYRLAENGATVSVPSARVAETRIQMAAAGLPKTGRVGFELFDKTNFGATDFAEQVNYHRALEGELERSILSLAEVEQARVHVTFAKESVFTESRQPAKASVLMKLRPGARLSAQNVAAVTHLIASSVQGLEADAVTVLDMRGNLLSRPRRHLPGEVEPSDAAIEYRQKIERDLLAKVNATLDPLLGPEKYRAGVYAECDFTSGEQSEEVFDPARSVMTMAQRTEDITGANTASGVPGTSSNLPRPASRPGALTAGVTRRTENITYQASRTVKRLRLPQGGLRRLSAAVLVDYVVRHEGAGPNARRIVEPMPAERLKVVRDLVAAAIGLVPDRGDQLTVESQPFESTLSWQPPESPAPGGPPRGGIAVPPWLETVLGNKLIAAGAAGGALLLLLLLAAAVALWRKSGKRRATATAVAEKALPRPDQESADDQLKRQMEAKLAEQAALKEKMAEEALNSLKVPAVQTKKTEVLAKHLAEEAKKDPGAVAQLVRSWLNDSD